MARKVNYQIFGALNILFAADKKVARKTRRALVAGRITKTEFDILRHKQNCAFDRRYGKIYNALA